MSEKYVSEPPIDNSTYISHTAHTDLIVPQNIVHIVNITVAAPSVQARLPLRKLTGVLLGIAAPRQRP